MFNDLCLYFLEMTYYNVTVDCFKPSTYSFDISYTLMNCNDKDSKKGENNKENKLLHNQE